MSNKQIDLVNMKNLEKILDSYKNIIKMVSDDQDNSSVAVDLPKCLDNQKTVTFSNNNTIIPAGSVDEVVPNETTKNLFSVMGFSMQTSLVYYIMGMLVMGAIIYYSTRDNNRD